MHEVERTAGGTWDDRSEADVRDEQIASLEEALTLAAAAPGRRRLERLEELLLVRAGQASGH
jgi:hypothetical protein